MDPRFQHTVLSNPDESTLYTKKRDNNFRAIVLVILISSILALILLASDGSLFGPVAFIGLLLIIAVSFYRLDWGFFLFIGMVMAFDQFPPRGYESSIIGLEYFENLKSLSFLSSVDFAAINPLEIHLGLLSIVWFLLIAMGRRIKLQHVPLWPAALLFFGWLIFSAGYGMATGGDFLPALWELRALCYLGIMYFFVPQIIQTRKQLNTLTWVLIGTILFKVLQGLLRVVSIGFQFGDRTELTNHEDPLFLVSIYVLLLGFILFGARTKQQKVILWTLLPSFLVFILAQRRATYMALGTGILAFMLLLPNNHRRKMVKGIVPVLIVFIVYLAVFWNGDGIVALPAQLVKSSFSNDKETAGDRYGSNLYREVENYNLSQTLKRSPFIGIGFGKKYDQPLILPSIPFSLRDYIPHNEIYWLIVKTGSIGFFFFWFFLDVYVFQAVYIFSKIKDPYLKSICAMIIIAILGQIIVSFVDLQLTFYRNMIFLGLCMGLLPTLRSLDAKPENTMSEAIQKPQLPFS